MAILKNFIDAVSFDEVWKELGAGRPEMETYQEAYRQIFDELQKTLPQENTDHMTIKFVMEEPVWDFRFDEDTEDTEDADEAEESTETLEVYGFVPGDDEGYAIGVKPPEVLVGLDVDEETAKGYTPAEIVAHCLAEMTMTSTIASSAYGMEKDMAGGGLLASQSCMREDIQNIDLEKLRQELGHSPKPDEDYKEKYGFLF